MYTYSMPPRSMKFGQLIETLKQRDHGITHKQLNVASLLKSVNISDEKIIEAIERMKKCNITSQNSILLETERLIEEGAIGTPTKPKAKQIKNFTHGATRLLYRHGARPNETQIEMLVRRELEHRNIIFECQFPIGRYHADFRIDRVLVECDGWYWHSGKEMEEHDRKKDRFCSNSGYTVIRLTEEEIHKNVQVAVDKVIKVIGSEVLSR